MTLCNYNNIYYLLQGLQARVNPPIYGTVNCVYTSALMYNHIIV